MTHEQLVILGFLAVVSAVVGGFIGRAKGNAVAGALFGLLLGPIGWLIVGVTGRRNQTHE